MKYQVDRQYKPKIYSDQCTNSVFQGSKKSFLLTCKVIIMEAAGIMYRSRGIDP